MRNMAMSVDARQRAARPAIGPSDRAGPQVLGPRTRPTSPVRRRGYWRYAMTVLPTGTSCARSAPRCSRSPRACRSARCCRRSSPSARRLLDAAYAALGVPGRRTARSPSSSPTAQRRAVAGDRPAAAPARPARRDAARPDPVRLADIRQHPRFGWWPAAHPEMTDFLGMPIVDGDEILGELFLANKDGTRRAGFTDDDEELLAPARRARRDRPGQRPAVRAQPRTVHLEERNRIARELHDAVTQKLFSLRLTAEAAATLVDRDPARAVGRAGHGAPARRRRDRRAAGDRGRAAPGRPGRRRPGSALRKQAELLDRVHEPRGRASPAWRCRGWPATGRRRCTGSPRRRCTTRCGTAGRAGRRHGRRRGPDGSCWRSSDDGAGFDTAAAARRPPARPGLDARTRPRVGGRLTRDSAPGAGHHRAAGGADPMG